MLFILTVLTATFPRLTSLPTIKPMTLLSLIAYEPKDGKKMVPRHKTGPDMEMENLSIYGWMVTILKVGIISQKYTSGSITRVKK